jgi:hypothetical protein
MEAAGKTSKYKQYKYSHKNSLGYSKIQKGMIACFQGVTRSGARRGFAFQQEAGVMCISLLFVTFSHCLKIIFFDKLVF